MNKIVSTLVCGAFALVSFSTNAQYLKIQTGRGELVKKGDSTVLVAQNDPATMTAASLWKVDVDSRATSGNFVYKFTNKATNTTLKLNGEEWFAVGDKDAVRHQMDTLNVSTPADFKKLFTVEGGFTIATRDNNWGTFPKTIVPDTTIYADNDLSLILALPNDMTHWMSVAELNQCAKYMVPLFAQMEGIELEDAAYEFVSTAADAQSTDTIFTIQSKTSDKFLAVDSTNVTEKSTVNVGDPRQNKVFGFNVAFGAESAFDHFGILFNPVNDSIAVAVMDSVLGWDVVNKKLAENVVNEGEAVAWLGNARFINDEVEYITVDSLYNPTNGMPYWTPAPAQIEPGQPLADGLYILTAKDGKIWGVPFGTVCAVGSANNGNAQAAYTNEYVPENQWMITSSFEDGIYSYKATNRFYGGNYNIKKVTTCDDTYFILNSTDTVAVKAIDANYGYKVFDGDELESSSFTLGLVNKLGAEDVYMVMNEDSSLNVLKTDAPLEFRAKFADSRNFNLNEDGEKTFATDTLAMYHLYTLNADADTLWIGLIATENNNNITLTTKEDQQLRCFYFKAENEGEYKMLFNTKGIETINCSNTSGGWAVRVHENGGTTTSTQTTNNDVSLFTINYTLDDAEYARLEAGHYVIVDNSKGTVDSGDLSENEVLTKKENMDAKFLSTGDNLGSVEAIEENFSLWIDSACVSDEPGLRLLPTYYIMKDAAIVAEGDSLAGDFLTKDGSYKVNNDSLVFVTGKAKINDTMAKAQAADNTFLFKLTDVENQYTIHPAKNRKARLAQINGVVVISTDQDALPVVVTRTSAIPTSNENVKVSNVTVVAGKGQLTIAGAAGKKVVISNVLGQTVANTVIASDNATITAPAGVVVVAVEGEEAVKAIVK